MKAIFLLPLLLSSVATATLTVQESFAYTTGSDLGGQNGGTGFNAAWGAGTDHDISGTNTSLSYPASSPLTSSGAHLQISSTVTSATITRVLATGAQMSLGTSGQRFYSSMLISIGEIGQAAAVHFADNSNNVRWGYGINAAGNFFVGVDPGNVSQRAESSFTAIPGGTYLLVASIRTNTSTTPAGEDEVFMNIYSSTDTIIAPAADTDWQLREQGNSGVVLREVRLPVSNTAGLDPSSVLRIDEFRVGTTFQDVTGVVPEPSAALLSALSLSTLLLRRSKQR